MIRTPVIEDIETNKEFNKNFKTFIDESENYKLVESTITKENRNNLRIAGNGLTLLYLDKDNKNINTVKLDGAYQISCNVTFEDNIEITLQK